MPPSSLRLFLRAGLSATRVSHFSVDFVASLLITQDASLGSDAVRIPDRSDHASFLKRPWPSMTQQRALHVRWYPPKLSYLLALFVVALVSACGEGAIEPVPEPPNRPPAVAAAIPAQTIAAGETATVNVASSFSDPDGDALVFMAVTSNAAVATVAVSGTVIPTGTDSSSDISVTRSAGNTGVTEITIGSLPSLPDAMRGITLEAGDPLVLFGGSSSAASRDTRPRDREWRKD